jgi:hypothetical protein
MKIRTGLIVAGGGLLLLTASANAQMRGGGSRGGFGGMHGAPSGAFVVLPWEASGLQTELFTGLGVLQQRLSARNPTAAAHNGHGHNNHHHGHGHTRVVVGVGFWLGLGQLGLSFTGIRPIIMLRTATTPTPHHNIIVEASSRCITVAWSQTITASRLSIYDGNRMRR